MDRLVASINGTPEHPEIRGTVTFRRVGDNIEVQTDLKNLPSGVHGYHVHVYDIPGRPRPLRIEHHMHAWMDDHKTRYPHVKDVDAHTLAHHPLGYWDTVEEAWKALGVAGDIPAVDCRA